MMLTRGGEKIKEEKRDREIQSNDDGWHYD